MSRSCTELAHLHTRQLGLHSLLDTAGQSPAWITLHEDHLQMTQATLNNLMPTVAIWVQLYIKGFTVVSRIVTFSDGFFPERHFLESRFPDGHFPG